MLQGWTDSSNKAKLNNYTQLLKLNRGCSSGKNNHLSGCVPCIICPCKGINNNQSNWTTHFKLWLEKLGKAMIKYTELVHHWIMKIKPTGTYEYIWWHPRKILNTNFSGLMPTFDSLPEAYTMLLPSECWKVQSGSKCQISRSNFLLTTTILPEQNWTKEFLKKNRFSAIWDIKFCWKNAVE